jgi:hypothetical protein
MDLRERRQREEEEMAFFCFFLLIKVSLLAPKTAGHPWFGAVRYGLLAITC